MALVNGRLPRSVLAPITIAVSGEQAYLLKPAAKAFMAMNAESEARFGVTLRVASAEVAYRTYGQQVKFWRLYRAGKGNLAARPGTSNHGLGLAVDLATQEMRDIVDKIGAKYGWAKKWSDAPTEWWHIKYRYGIWNGRSPYAVNPVIKPGAYGRQVIHLKRAMTAHSLQGFNRFTPFYGKTAVDAIKRLQARHGLKADGIVGPTTWKVLS